MISIQGININVYPISQSQTALTIDITLGYAIAVGGVLLLLGLTNLLPCIPYLIPFARPFFYRTFRYLTYPYLVRRHRFLGPWTLADIIIQFIYIASNSFCLGFRVSRLGFRVASIAEAGIQAGILLLINMIPLFLGPHLSFLADILGVSLSTFRHIHRSAGLMFPGLVLFHALVIVTSGTAFASSDTKNLPAVIVSTQLALAVLPSTDLLQGGSSLGFIVVLSWPPLCRRFYEIFLRLHQILAAVIALSALLHVLSTFFPRLYFYIAFGIFIVTSAAEGCLLLHRNRIFAYSKNMQVHRVGEIFKYPDSDNNSPVLMTIFLERLLKIKAGQYINIWIRSLGVRSSIQSHPFVVASWTGKQQKNLELVIEPRRGLTKKLHSCTITASGQNGGLGRVLFTGPHGAVVPVDEYEYVFMIASDYGIVAHLPLLERLVQGTLAREVRARRICLVWEFEDIGKSDVYNSCVSYLKVIELYKAVYPLLNWVLLEDRKLGNNCIY
jgi:hypothetical protein